MTTASFISRTGAIFGLITSFITIIFPLSNEFLKSFLSKLKRKKINKKRNTS